jgi:DNA anti-recombination protein RmuC
MQFVVNHQKFREKFMTFIKKLSTSLIVFVSMFGLTACSDKEAEEAGRKVEETVKDASKMTQGAGDKVNEMKEDASKVIENASEKIDAMKESVSNKFGDMKKDTDNAIEGACEKTKEGADTKDDGC